MSLRRTSISTSVLDANALSQKVSCSITPVASANGVKKTSGHLKAVKRDLVVLDCQGTPGERVLFWMDPTSKVVTGGTVVDADSKATKTDKGKSCVWSGKKVSIRRRSGLKLSDLALADSLEVSSGSSVSYAFDFSSSSDCSAIDAALKKTFPISSDAWKRCKALMKAIKKADGAGTKGIYRLSGSSDDQQQVIAYVQNGNGGVPKVDVTALAAGLKQAVKTFEPLVPFDLYSGALSASTTGTTMKVFFDNVLKPTDQQRLTDLFAHLKEIIDNSKVNLMTLSNMAVVWGPNTLGKRNMTPQEELDDNGKIQKAFTALYCVIYSDQSECSG